MKKIISRTEELHEETNKLLKINIILSLADKGVPHQAIRRIVGGDMKFVTAILKPIKSRSAAT